MDAASSIFSEIKKKGLHLIDIWIHEKLREDLYLDFKCKSEPTHHKPMGDDRKNFSKGLSAFANSAGGLIVWGIKAPSSGIGVRTKSPIKNPHLFAEHLDSLASRLVAPAVEGVENFVVWENKQKKTGYVISFIPKSLAAPHRAEGSGIKKYFQRAGDSFVQIEHWQLEYMFGRRLSPELKILWAVDIIDSNLATIRIKLQNKGRSIARYSCLRIFHKSEQKRYRIIGNIHPLVHYHQNKYVEKKGFLEITGRADPALVIYPGDRVGFYHFDFNFDRNELVQDRLQGLFFFYDLYGENFKGVMGQKFKIHGDLISKALLSKIK